MFSAQSKLRMDEAICDRFASRSVNVPTPLTRPSDRWQGGIGWSAEGLTYISADHFSQRQHLHGRI
jgi:hypothetical protein